MKAFTLAKELDHICRNCDSYDADMEIGGMYGTCIYAIKLGKHGKNVVKEADRYCDEST